MSSPPRPPPDWYPDPAGGTGRRYWDGTAWTDRVVTADGGVDHSPLDPSGAVEAWSALEDHRAPWSGWTALLAVGAMLLGSVVGAVLASLGSLVNTATSLAMGSAGLYGTLFLTCWLVSERQGRGGFRRDYGLEYRSGDWWRGLAVSVLGRLGAAIVLVILVLIMDDLAGDNSAALDEHKDSLPFVLTAAVLACVAAPFFEELFFRGLLQRSFETVLPASLAIGAQGLVFGFAHFGGGEGAGNVGVVLSTAVAGVAFGVAARRYHRLGPGIAAHSFFNALPVAVLLLTR